MIAERPNVCKQLHMPAQSGSTDVLARMRRGYSREAYDELVAHVRQAIPEVALRCGVGAGSAFVCGFLTRPLSTLRAFSTQRVPIPVPHPPKCSTDMIVGFCGESEEDHAASLDLMAAVQYDQAFLFAYSRRDKTHAARHYEVGGCCRTSVCSIGCRLTGGGHCAGHALPRLASATGRWAASACPNQCPAHTAMHAIPTHVTLFLATRALHPFNWFPSCLAGRRA